MTTRCTKCLMPDDYPDITFDDGGICNYCQEYKKPQLLGEALFLQKLGSKGDQKYDCILGISGGKDSCYVAYLAKKKFGLRVLAVSYDFPFMVDLARQNSRTVCENLDIELLIIKSQNNFETSLIRNHLISLAATGTTWGQCMFCHYGIEAVLYQTAIKNEIPFILSGVTKDETWWDPGNRLKFLINNVKKLNLKEQMRFGAYQSKAFIYLVDQRRQFPIAGNHLLDVYRRASTPPGGPETIHVFDYIEWDQEKIEKTLQAEVGWKKPSTALSWRYDCILEPLLDITFKKDLGISSSGLYICGLIRAGQINREEGLRLLTERENPERLNASLKTVLEFLKIPTAVQVKLYMS